MAARPVSLVQAGKVQHPALRRGEVGGRDTAADVLGPAAQLREFAEVHTLAVHVRLSGGGSAEQVTWVRIDDRFDEHPKIVGAGPVGLAVFVRGLCYCARNLTDGFIPKTVAWKLMYDVDISREAVIDLMIHSKLWERGEDGGFRVHDYLAYNPSRTEVLEAREARAEAGRKGGLAKAKQVASTLLDDCQPCASSKPLANVCPVPVPVPDPVPLSVPQKVQPMRPERSRRAATTSDDPAFTAFWLAYPTARRRGKFEAHEAWKQLRLTADEKAEVLRSLEAWKASWDWRKDDGKFVPWPQKFLRKRRWQEIPESGDPQPRLIHPRV